MNDRPIVESLLDVDFYKDTMGQMIFHKHPKVPVKFAFKNRHKHVRLAECIDLGRLREELDHLRTVRFSRLELKSLLGTLEYNELMFKFDYIKFLETFQLPEYHLGTRDGQLDLEFFGEWPYVSRWETLAMQVVSELYGEYQVRGRSQFERKLVWAEGERRLGEKIRLFKFNPQISFSDFGTRRRFSRAWHEHVISILADEFPQPSVFSNNPQFRGTSNIWLAMKYGLTPMGTNAHELAMVYSAIYYKEDEAAKRLVSQRKVLEDWESEYGLGLSIFLPDTYGSDYFFSKVATPEMLRSWKGSRHDSGDPFEYGEKRIRMYHALGIDPLEKLIVFADGLNPTLVVDLESQFRAKIRTTFGIGTNLTNDVGPRPGQNFDPLSIVVKPIEASGLPVVKLSDNLEKATGDPVEIERMKKLVGYNLHFAEACRY